MEHQEATMEEPQLMAARPGLMEALGQLAGGMAHDFNNVLQAISGAGELLHGQLDQPQAIVRVARTISNAVERGASVTERLLAFAQCSNLRAIPVDTEQVLTALHPLLAQILGSSITVRTEIEPALPPLMADKRQLETTLISLATNARDAMPVGGAVTVSATKRTVCRDNRDVTGFASGDYINIVVSDTGTGMDATTLSRATEPFFTTKPTGKGTGLGLSVAKGFSEQSGGDLLIESSPGNGTAVSIVLPVADVVLEERPERINDLEQTRILLVDDDVLVRDVLREQLELTGYIVVAAANGIEAVAAFEAKAFDLLLTDFSMPGIDGVTLITRLRGLEPSLPAILMTGYAADSVKVSENGSYRLLRKPFTMAKLNAEVAACRSDRAHLYRPALS